MEDTLETRRSRTATVEDINLGRVLGVIGIPEIRRPVGVGNAENIFLAGIHVRGFPAGQEFDTVSSSNRFLGGLNATLLDRDAEEILV